MEEMTKWERIAATVKGDPVDRVPINLARHVHAAENNPDTQAAEVMEQNRKFDWDFHLIIPRMGFFGEPWGCKYRWDPVKGQQQVDYVVKQPQDFYKLKKLDPTKGTLGNELNLLRLLKEGLNGSAPYIKIVFCPLSVATWLAGGTSFSASETTMMKRFMKENPAALLYGLSIIGQTMADFARECIRAGAAGIALTTTVWSRDAITEEEYKIFGRPYDLAIYEAAIQEGATLNLLHLCRENVMLELLSDYPVQIIQYYDRSPRNPNLKEAIGKTNKALWGGINQETTLPNGPVEAIIAEVHDALQQTNGRRFILGPGCTPIVPVPEAHLMAAIKAVLL